MKDGYIAGEIQDKIGEIINKIRILRLSKGYSQLYMAAKLNITQNGFSKVELGKVSLTVEKLLLIADALEVELIELL